MGVEIILNQDQFLGVGIIHIDPVLKQVSLINGASVCRHHDPSPPHHRFTEHEQVGRSLALVFIIDPGRLSGFRRQRDLGFLNELFGRFIDANDGNIGVVRRLIDR